MKILKILFACILGIVVLITASAFMYLHSKQPKRSGKLTFPDLAQTVTVHFDKWAVPHIYAQNENDAYYALGYVHAQERLFHMEILRRLSKGQLSEILGSGLVPTDTFFRTLRLKQFGKEYMEHQDHTSPAYVASESYIKGINKFIETGPTPIEFDILGIPKTPFAFEDIISLAGYMSYSFASGFTTDPLLTFIRDELGHQYLNDLEYKMPGTQPLKLLSGTHKSLRKLTGLMADIEKNLSPIGFFSGSNAWVVSGNKTVSGRPILAGDPHIEFSCPSVWYEAHIVTPGFELYGHYLSGCPFPLLGLNNKIAWSLTMFQNDDVDLFLERTNPENPDQVWSDGKWVDLIIENERINVKGAEDVLIRVRRSKHGPILNDVVTGLKNKKEPVAAWWAFYDFSNNLTDGFYNLAHADDAYEAGNALRYLHAPGLNFVLGDARGNIAWWAVGSIPIRPSHVDPNFILDGSSGKDDYLGMYDFNRNPQIINPASGYIVSANHQPQDFGEGTVPGYYNLDNRAKRIEALLGEKETGWTNEDMKVMQLDTRSTYCLTVRDGEVGILKTIDDVGSTTTSAAALAIYREWNGDHSLESIGPTIFNTLHYHLAELIFMDEIGDDRFKGFLQTRLPDRSIDKLLEIKNAVWWDNINTPEKETREDILQKAWEKTISHLKDLLGDDPSDWAWGKVHTVEYIHAMGRKKPMDKLFNIGPFPIEGSREVPNFTGFKISPAPHKITIGPSTRRIIDFGSPENSLGINPTGQSGYFFNDNFDDQADMYIKGQYRKHLLNRDEILKVKTDTLVFQP